MHYQIGLEVRSSFLHYRDPDLRLTAHCPQVRRVPTHDNIADDPSREDYELLRWLGATWLAPATPEYLWDTSLWEQAVLTGQRQ